MQVNDVRKDEGKYEEDTWKAELELVFTKDASGVSRMLKNRHKGPLTVLKPYYPETACHVYMLHPPGGVASCDEIKVEVTANKGSHVLITTPGATKYYKSSGQSSLVKQDFYVDEDASIEFLPAQNIFYKGTKTRVYTTFHLKKNAAFAFRDISKCGLEDENEPFSDSSFLNVIKVETDGEIQFIDSTLIDGNDDYYGIASLCSNPYLGTFICKKVSESTLEKIKDFLSGRDFIFAAGIIKDFTVLRFSGKKNEVIENAIVRVWEMTREENTSLAPCLPRIWST